MLLYLHVVCCLVYQRAPLAPPPKPPATCEHYANVGVAVVVAVYTAARVGTLLAEA